MDIAEEIRREMGAKRITIGRLAELSNLSRKTITRKVMANERSLTVDDIEKICSALDLDIATLVERASMNEVTA